MTMTDYSVVFDANPDAIFILDSNGKILKANRSAVQRYGYSLAELREMNVADLAAQDMQDQVRPHLQQSLESGDRFEWRHRCKDGSELPVEIFSQPIIHHGKQAILSSARDISQRKETETKLQEQQHFLEQVLNTEPGTVYIYDLLEQRNIYINRHWLSAFGYTPEETQAMGSEVLWLFHPDDLSRISANHEAERDAADGEISLIEYRIRDKDGTWHWLLSRETPFTRDESGKVSRILGIAHDISARKRAEALTDMQRDVLEMIAAGTSLPEALAVLIHRIEDQSPGMLGSILLLDEDGIHVRHGAAPSLPAEFIAAVEGQPIGPNAGSCGTAAYRKEAVFVEDIATDPLWENYQTAALPHGLRACWSTPIFDSQQKVLGTFAMYYRQPGLPLAEHLQLIDIATHIASIAISRHRADEALHMSEERIRNVFEQANDGIYIISAKNRHLDANARGLELLGYTRDEFLKMGVADVLAAHEVARLAIEPPQVMSGVPHLAEWEFVRKDGSMFPGEVSARRLDDHSYLAIVRDLTERKQAEAALRESNEKLRLFIQYAPSAIAMFDRDMRYIVFSRRWLADYGLDEQELAGRSHYEIFPDLPERWKEIHRRCMAGSVEKCDEDHFPRADGSLDWVRWETHPWRTGQGDIGGIIIFSEVITERKQAEAALRESETKYRAIIESSPVAMAINDEHQNITFLNHKFIETFGYTLADIPTLAEWWLRAYPDPVHRQRVAEEWQAAVEKAQRDHTELEPLEYEVTAKDGSVRDIRFSMALIGTSSLVIFYDLTERKQAEAELRKLSLAVEQSPNSIVITNLEANIEYVNNTFLKLTGYSRDEVIGKNPRVLQSGKTPKTIHEDMWAHLSRGELWRGELINKRKDDSEYIELAIISPVRQADGRITHYLAIKENITEAKKAEERIESLAHFDQLTGLPNRILLSDRFKYSLSLAQRSGEPLAVMFLDLDHFKNVNDTLGHTIGDQLLMEMARRIKDALREEDTVSRMGGDEFILILPGTDTDGAAHVAAKLIEAVPQPCLIGQHELITTASIGIAIYPNDGEELETLSKNADAAMYRVKKGGRNNFCFYSPEMQEHTARTLLLANALRHALARNELQLLYQPQLSMQDGHIVGAEALLRWHHPELGMISPAEFIPIAEDSGQIIPIGEWVLRTASKQLKDWMNGGLPPMVMAVNLSSVQFRQANITELVTNILDEINLPHEYLELELTEAVAMDDPLAAIEVMDKLQEHGIRMSIDDFGTGYSSLSYLKKFKVYKLKIDQSFVRDITEDPEDKAIVSAIINMAASLGIQTIAEGVETAGQLAFLRLQGCNEVQGYYFSKPLPAEQFEAFVKAN